MWISAVGLSAMKRRLGVPLHSTVNWWNVSLAWNVRTEFTWTGQHSRITVSFTWQMFQHLVFYLVVKSHIPLICFSVAPPFISSFSTDTLTATVLFFFPLQEENPMFSSSSFSCWHVSILCTWIHELSLFLWPCIRLLGMAVPCV